VKATDPTFYDSSLGITSEYRLNIGVLRDGVNLAQNFRYKGLPYYYYFYRAAWNADAVLR